MYIYIFVDEAYMIIDIQTIYMFYLEELSQAVSLEPSVWPDVVGVPDEPPRDSEGFIVYPYLQI